MVYFPVYYLQHVNKSPSKLAPKAPSIVPENPRTEVSYTAVSVIF